MRARLFAAALAVGFASMAYGAWLLSVPLGFAVGGLLFTVWAWAVLAE